MNRKNILKTLAAALLMPTMLLTASCSSDDDFASDGKTTTESVAKKGYAFPVTVSATRQGDGTRAHFNSETQKLEFTAGDKLFVKGAHSTANNFGGTLDYDAVSEKFSGTIYTESEYTGTVDELFSQNAQANLLPKDYEGYGYVSLSGSGYETEISFTPAKAFAESKAAGVEQLSRESVYSYSSGFALAPKNAILNFTINDLDANTEVAVSLGDDYITGNVTTDASGTAKFAIAMPGEADLFDYKTLTVGSNAITLVSESKPLTAGKIYNITRSAAAAAVDLGLSVRWAKMNVGAATEGDYGLFFAWGETTGYSSTDTSDGHNFGWASYKWCNGSNTTLTKYNNKSDYGTVDNKTTLEAADDAATAIMGSPWRMPTGAEWEELLATKTNTAQYTWTWATANGHDGYRITRKSTGANIFLPAAGYRDGTSLGYQGSRGYYWSSSLYESNASYAPFFYFNSSTAYMYNHYSRYYGRSVRAVQSK